MPRVTLMNDGPGDRGMYDANHQPITIRAGESRENVELSDADIAHLREMDERAKLQNKREQLRVVQPAEEQQGTAKVVDVSEAERQREEQRTVVDLTDKDKTEPRKADDVTQVPAQRTKKDAARG